MTQLIKSLSYVNLCILFPQKCGRPITGRAKMVPRILKSKFANCSRLSRFRPSPVSLTSDLNRGQLANTLENKVEARWPRNQARQSGCPANRQCEFESLSRPRNFFRCSQQCQINLKKCMTFAKQKVFLRHCEETIFSIVTFKTAFGIQNIRS